MSYVIHLWEHPAPATMEEALALHERLLDSTAAAPTARFATLLDRLVQRFPAQVGGVDAEEPTWVEPAPPTVDVEGVVLSLALYGDGPSELLPVLVDEAGALGLSVLDEQGGCLFLPGRLQLDMEGLSERPRAAAPAPQPERLTSRIAKARIRAVMASPMARHGFSMGTDEDGGVLFTRPTTAGTQHIYVYHANEAWQYYFFAWITPDLPPHLAKVVAYQRRTRLVVPVHPALQGFERYGSSDPFDEFVACSVAELDSLLEAFLVSIEAQCLPALEACRTAAGLLAFDQATATQAVHLNDSIVLLALNHWIGQEDMAVVIERQLAKSGHDRTRKRILGETAEELAALPRSVA